MNEWDTYWANGHNDCFPSESAEEMKEYVNAIWKGIFKEEGGIPKKVLDVCCGSGYIGRAIEGVPIDISTSFQGVDAAKIPNSNKAPYPIKSDVSVEDLPFEEGVFDVLVSNFGIEYTDIHKALEELVRVSANDFNWYFICHTTESVYSKDSLNVIQELQPFFQRIMFSNSPNLHEAKIIADAAKKQLQTMCSGATSDVLTKLLTGCDLAINGQIELRMVVDFLQGCQSYVLRMTAQYAAAKQCDQVLIPLIQNQELFNEKEFVIENIVWRGEPIAKLIKVVGIKK